MTDKKLKFAIIGAGSVATFHADAIQSIENAQLAGVFDQNSENTSRFAKKYNITSFSDFESVLENPDIDVICVCTPSNFHADNAVLALNYKKHVIVEKPMALSSSDAERIIEASEKSGVLLTVISQLRFSKDIQKVKKLVEENAFGKISFCDLYMKYWRDPEYYTSSPWKGRKAFDGGGALMNQGIHGVDLILYIMGNAQVIGAKTKTVFHDIEVEDTVAAILEFDSGALGVVEGSTCAYPGFERRIEITGSTGYVTIKEDVIEKLVIDKKTIIDNSNPDVLNSSSVPDSIGYERHSRQIRNFIDAVLGKDKLLIDASEGKKAVKLIEDIYRLSD